MSRPNAPKNAGIAYFRLVRFLGSGAVNTALTYFLYLGLLMVLPATVSYSIAFLAGIVLAYFMQRYFVFKQRGRDYGFVLTLMIYCLQYGIGIALVFVWTDYFKLPALFAPLVSIVVTLPITYFLSQKVFSDPD